MMNFPEIIGYVPASSLDAADWGGFSLQPVVAGKNVLSIYRTREGARKKSCDITQATMPVYVMYNRTCEQIREMQERLRFLDALEEAGVDNWEGISHAYELMEEGDL